MSLLLEVDKTLYEIISLKKPKVSLFFFAQSPSVNSVQNAVIKALDDIGLENIRSSRDVIQVMDAIEKQLANQSLDSRKTFSK